MNLINSLTSMRNDRQQDSHFHCSSKALGTPECPSVDTRELLPWCRRWSATWPVVQGPAPVCGARPTRLQDGLLGGFGAGALRRASRLLCCHSAGDFDLTTGCFKAGPPLSWKQPLGKGGLCSDLTGRRLRPGLGRGCRRGATQRPMNS